MSSKLLNPESEENGRGVRGGIRNMSMRKLMMMAMMPLWGYVAHADIAVSDVQVFSGHPWKEVVVGYTITGVADDTARVLLTATDKDANKTYIAEILIAAELTAGRHILRWNAASEGVKFASTNVVFVMEVVSDAVQLWDNGPYWAGCNVGASKPEECGYYFWWGDTVGCTRNAANNGWVSAKDGTAFSFSYRHCPTYGKNNSQLQSAGYIDATGNLVAAYDAATVHLGAPWRMPTDAEMQQLISNCDTTWTTRGGVHGRLVTGRGAYAAKSIFLPAAGRGYESYLDYAGLYGHYWSSTPYSDISECAWDLYFNSGSFSRYSYYSRSNAKPVRPVRGFVK